MTNHRTRRQSHIYYTSNCAICSELFTHDRRSAVFCSKKCRNKSRSFSLKFLDSLTRKSMMTIISYTRLSELEITATTALANSTVDLRQLGADIGIPPEELRAAINFVNNEKAKRRLQAEAQRLGTMFIPATNENDHSNFVDPEMAGFKLESLDTNGIDDITKDNLKFINKTDPANGGSDGFGLLDEGTATNEDKSCTETNPKPVVQLSTEARLSFSQSTQSISKSPSKGLRRLGGK